MTRDAAESVALSINLHRDRMDVWLLSDIAQDLQNAFPEFHWYLNRETKLLEIFDA